MCIIAFCCRPFAASPRSEPSSLRATNAPRPPRPHAPPAPRRARRFVEFTKASTGNVADAVDEATGQRGFMYRDMKPVFKTKIMGPATTAVLRRVLKGDQRDYPNRQLEILDESGSGRLLRRRAGTTRGLDRGRSHRSGRSAGGQDVRCVDAAPAVRREGNQDGVDHQRRKIDAESARQIQPILIGALHRFTVWASC